MNSTPIFLSNPLKTYNQDKNKPKSPSTNRSLTEQIEALNASTAAFRDQYTEISTARRDWQKQSLKYEGVIGLSTLTATSSGAGAIVSIHTLVGGAILRENSERFTEEFYGGLEEQRIRNTENFLKSRLETLGINSKEDLNTLQEMSPEKRKTFLFGSQGKADVTLLLEGIDEKNHPVVLNYAIKALDRQAQNNFELFSEELKHTNTRVDSIDIASRKQLEAQANFLTTSLETYNETLTDFHNELKHTREAMAKIHGQVTTNTEGIQTNAAAISALSDFAWSRMSTRQQLNSLDKLYPNMKPGPKNDLRSSLEHRAALESTMEKLNVAKQAMLLARQVGLNVPPELVGMVSVTSLGMQAAINFSSGNLMGGISNVVGIVTGLRRMRKKPKPTPAQLMHQQLMKGISELMKGQAQLSQQMVENTQLVLEGQQELYKELIDIKKDLTVRLVESHREVLQNQSTILQAISETAESIQCLGKTILETQSQVMHQLEKLQADILVNRTGIRFLLSQGLRDAQSFIEQKKNHYTKLSDLQADFGRLGQLYSSGIHSLEDILSYSRQNHGIHPTLLTATYEEHISDSDRFIRQEVTDPLFAFYRNCSSEDVKMIIRRLLNPVGHSKHMCTSLQDETTSTNKEYLAQRENFAFSNIHRTIKVEALVDICTAYLDFLTIDPFVQHRQQGIIWKTARDVERAIHPETRRGWRNNLLSALTLVDVSLAQQYFSLGQGTSLVLPKLISETQPAEKKETLKNLTAAVSKYPPLNTAFFTALLYHFNDTNKLASYSLAYTTALHGFFEDLETFFPKNFSSVFVICKKKDTNSLQVKLKINVKDNEPEILTLEVTDPQVIRGETYTPQTTGVLFNLREKLIHALFALQIPEEIEDEELRAWLRYQLELSGYQSREN